MTDAPNPALVIAALLSATAALLHLACIAIGPRAYRWAGAGERMARMAAAGDWRAAAVTFFVTAVLAVWSLYALSGAGVIPALPLTRLALCVITGIYLARAMFFPLLRRHLPENSWTFWWWSSAICLLIGIVHLLGLVQVWGRL